MEQEHRFVEIEKGLKQVNAKLDALSRIVLRVFDFDGSMTDLIDGARAPTTLEKDKFRSALLYASEMFSIRDEIKEALKWVKEQKHGETGSRENWGQLLRGLAIGVLGALAGALASHFLAVK